MESNIKTTMEIKASVEAVYELWSDYEHYPNFMRGVVEVTASDDTHHHWLADVGGLTEEWDTEITENIPNQRISWHSTSGAKNSGVVSFERIANDATRLNFEMTYEPSGMVENIGDALGFVRRRIEGDMQDFKQLLEH